jgi:hypothetical protein
MSEKPHLVDIHPQDDENTRAIIDKIYAEKIIDEEAIRALVDTFEFSSPETKQHVSDSIINLLRVGALDPNKPRQQGIEMEIIEP